MLQRNFPIKSEATIHAWRLPYGVGWTRYSSTLPQLYLVYFSWVGIRPNLLWCNKDSIWESCNKFRCDWTLNLCINVLCVPAWSWDGTATQRPDRFRVGSLHITILDTIRSWKNLHWIFKWPRSLQSSQGWLRKFKFSAQTSSLSCNHLVSKYLCLLQNLSSLFGVYLQTLCTPQKLTCL